MRRARSETWDVAVIGGGVTGAGVALDAATRGLRTILLERGDLASGTSSRSGRTLHGGLRYLEQGNLGLVRDAARERDLAVSRLCPHLTRVTRFLVPLTRRGVDRAYLGAGVALYDLLAGRAHALPWHRHLSRRGALAAFPELRAEGLVGALQYADAIVDDARHTLTVARTAAAHGAAILPRAEVTGLALPELAAVDRESGEPLRVRARVVINAAGAGAAAVQRLAGGSLAPMRPSKGIHLVVARERFAASTGLMARAGDSVVVVRPSEGGWLIGTTDTPWDGEGEPVATAADVDELLGAANAWLRRPLTRADVAGAFAGVRPLVGEQAGGPTAALRRDHSVIHGPDGLLTVVGGKYTTYRLMARDAVDAAAARLGSGAPCVTASTPLLGATQATDRLTGRYGTLAGELRELIAERPGLGEPIPGGGPYTGAEIVYAAAHEGALRLEDVLERRTHIATEQPDRGLEAAPHVAELLGWEDQLDAYGRRAEALRPSALR